MPRDGLTAHAWPSPVTRVPVPDLCALWAETSTTPMQIALVGTCDAAPWAAAGTAPLDVVRCAVAAHLHRAPMLRRKLLHTHHGQGRTAWIDAVDFRLEEHVVLARPGGSFVDEQQFLDWCARETLVPLDRSKPLWRISVVPDLPQGRVGILVVVHHVVADGLRGVAMIAGLLDAEPVPAQTPVIAWQPAPVPTPTGLVVDNARARVAAIRSIRRSSLRHRWVALRGLRRELPTRAPATVLGGEIGPGRQLVVIREPLTGLKDAAHHRGCTVNDLLLAAVTAGLRDMLQSQGVRVDDMVLRTSVPVGEVAGRQSGMITLGLPVGIADPGERLRQIAGDTARGKQSPHAGIAGIVAMPASVARLGVLWARSHAVRHINLYVTNVPGPQFPLYLAGARLRDVVPLAPLVAGVRLSVTAMSYDGTFAVALLADEAVTGFDTLTTGVHTALAGFRSCAGIPDERQVLLDGSMSS